MGPSETCSITDTKLKKIAWLSARDPHKQFDCLMHHFNEESLAGCFHELDGRKAVGIDGIDKEDYGRELEANLEDLVARMKRMAYRPGPVRQVLIDKEDNPGEKRPLGISNFEDKIVQRMVHKVLASIYEPLFLDCSYGFRQGLGCHDAIQALWRYLYRWDVQTILDVDLARFFDTIDKQRLLAMLSEKIKDQRFLRYLVRMFKGGVLAEGELQVSEEGVPQGSICSPILANIFAHYVIDTWFEETVRPQCAGRVALFRYADDAVVCCQYAWDAERIRAALAERLAKYHLALNEEKTKLIPFQRAQRGDGRAAFDFLGFTFYWGQSRSGVVIPKVKTIGKRFRQKLRRVNDWARVMRHRYRLPELWARFCAKLQGHIQYYGVTFNLGMVRAFVFRATQYLFKWLNRRSQRQSFSWARFLLFIKAHPLPAVRAYHPLCTFQ
jgi:RNA-directed DNA polymerase